MSVSHWFWAKPAAERWNPKALDAAVERLCLLCIKCTLEIFIWTLCIYCFFAMSCPVCVICSQGDKRPIKQPTSCQAVFCLLPFGPPVHPPVCCLPAP